MLDVVRKSVREMIDNLDQRVEGIENRFGELGYDFKRIVVSEIKKRWKFIPQNETYFGVYTAICIDTKDPLLQGRIRFYSPFLNRKETRIEQLDWAYPCSAMGGFDDCGLVWVPPAGSKVLILFERGSRSSPYYIGTTWDRNRDPDGQHNWGYTIDEYYQLYEGDRRGYIHPPDDGSRVMPQWNIENYEEFDVPKLTGNPLTNDPIPPNIYGFKSPQKHMVKLVDGYKKKDWRFKRMELLSSLGNWMIFKDDPLHKDGEWSHPDCGGDHSENEYFKHKNECRPYRGPGTPQNNRSALHNTGIQLLSISGHTMIFDDKFKGEGKVPNWRRSMEPHDFGDLCEGKIKIISSTGHRFEMSDKEDIPKNRGPENYIRMVTASGNALDMNDHTLQGGIAGDKRGITLQSTSRHTIEMLDEGNEQKSPERMEIGRPADEGDGKEPNYKARPISKAKNGFIRIRTGYGLEIMMHDAYSQEETMQQYVQILCPFKTCPECGPHLMRFQELCGGNGYVFLRVAGIYICSTCKDHITVVGDKEKFPSDKITIVSRDTFINTEEYYINVAKAHLFVADEFIALLVGHDCKDDGPCAFPVCVFTPNGIVASDYVFASASPKAPTLSIFHLLPFFQPQWDGEED